MKSWNEMSNYEQVMLWWEYNASMEDDEQISFEEFEAIMVEAGF